MKKQQWLWIGLLGTIFVIAIGWLQWWKYTHFGYNGLDLGIYSQVVWSLAHGHGFASSIHDPSYLGDHLELWLIPVSWVYRLWGSPLTLLWIQTLVLASSLIPLAKLANKLLNGKISIVVCALFVVHPLLYNVALYEFHGMAFALPLLLWSIWWYSERRLNLWLVSLVLILFVREDMPFIVAGWGILAAIDRRSWRWWAPALVFAAGWFPAAQEIIRTANHDGVYKYMAFYRWLGTTPTEIVTFPFRHPLLFLQQIITFNNLGTIIGLTVTVGFLCWLRPRRLWPLLLVGAQLLIGNSQPGTYLRLHYTIPFLPFIAWAAFEALRDFRRGKLLPRLDRRVAGVAIPLLAIVAPLYSSLVIGPAEWPWSGVQHEPLPTSTAMLRAVRDVQPNDRVLTTFAFLPSLANRNALYSFNYLYLGRRQYSEIPYTIPTDIDVAVIDWQQLYDYQFLYLTTVFQGQSGLQRIQNEFTRQGLGVVARYGTITVYRRGGSADTSSTPSDTKNEPHITMGSVAMVGQPTLSLASDPALGQRVITITNAWQAISTKQDSPVSIRYTIRQNGTILDQQPRIIGQGPQPASEWPIGSTWRTHDTVLVSNAWHGTVTITAEIYIPQGRYRLNRLRTFQDIIDSSKQLGQVTVGTLRL